MNSLPFLKNKEASVAYNSEHIKRKPDEEHDEMDMFEIIADELIHAIHSKDSKQVAECLKAAFSIADSLPHYEGEHLED